MNNLIQLKNVSKNYINSKKIEVLKNVNYTLKHFAERIKLYNEENFDYKIYKVKLNGRRIQTPTVI